jgi:UPF0042 nucleotide-binding protein
MADGDRQMRIAARADCIPDVVVITGMSGSGRTQALHVFEDMGYYCIDNLPPGLILQLSHIVGINNGVGRHLAVTCDLRSQGLFDELDSALADLSSHDISYKVLFLDCSDEVLRRRFDENRRRHPLQISGESVEHAIKRERKQLIGVHDRADSVIDTSHMRTATLRARIRQNFSELSEEQIMDVNIFSFGFKHGLPVEADLMIDVRFLPNPFYDPEMRNLTGNDEKVARYVLGHPTTKEFMVAWKRLLDVVLPGYVAEGKPTLTIAIGCTGGQHRSVAIANASADYLKERGYRVNLSHRDLGLAVPRRGVSDAH